MEHGPAGGGVEDAPEQALAGGNVADGVEHALAGGNVADGVEHALAGGNVADAVVRVGDTVRKPAGYWTPSVEGLLAHLEAGGFGGAPRALGRDERGRQVLE